MELLATAFSTIATTLYFIAYEVWWYGWFWLLFFALAFCATRFLGGMGILLGAFLLAVILFMLDANWIYDDMRNHPENGRDADFVFMFGVLLRAGFFNLLLLPVSLFGLRQYKRRRVGRLNRVAA